MVTTVDKFLRWAQSNSMWPLTFGLACCAIEMMNLVAPRYDIARFGSEAFRASPRQADLLIVSGRLCYKMLPVIQQVYEQMPEPKWVVSMGACASSGGIFDNYAVVQGVDQLLPVDVYVPGCPPTPDAVIDGIQKLRAAIAAGESKGGVRGHA
jgi:NADH-quinone oxidoreductase subunit B